MITVTKPFLPPQEEYNKFVNGIWKRNWLTNNGPLVNDFELKVKEYLGLDHFAFLANGTLALQLAIKALELSGEIITTPFTYIATSSSVVWQSCKPVFVDIESAYFNIDPQKIEAAITDKTSAVLATHIFGYPCQIDEIQRIADKHKLKVIYDASHCFGTRYKEKSVFKYGDLSTVSFHATKLIHTIEGGGIFTTKPDLLKKVTYLRNFGHDGPYHFEGLGINAKNSEFHAAMGLSVLPYADKILEKRKSDSAYYDSFLEKYNQHKLVVESVVDHNFAYYPFLFENETICIKVIEELENNRVSPRRYFYPLLSDVNYLKGDYDVKIASDVSKRIICLPLFYDLTAEEIDYIIRIIIRTIKYF